MAIKLTFENGSELTEVFIDGDNLFFSNGEEMTVIDGLQILKSDVVKQFPDLVNDEEWRKKSIERLKEHIKNIPTEREKAIYVRNELVKYGNELKFCVRNGFRPKKTIEENYGR